MTDVSYLLQQNYYWIHCLLLVIFRQNSIISFPNFISRSIRWTSSFLFQIYIFIIFFTHTYIKPKASHLSSSLLAYIPRSLVKALYSCICSIPLHHNPVLEGNWLDSKLKNQWFTPKLIGQIQIQPYTFMEVRVGKCPSWLT